MTLFNTISWHSLSFHLSSLHHLKLTLTLTLPWHVLSTHPHILSTYQHILSTYQHILSTHPPILSTYQLILSTYQHIHTSYQHITHPHINTSYQHIHPSYQLINTSTHPIHTSYQLINTSTHPIHTSTHLIHTSTHPINTSTHLINTSTHLINLSTHQHINTSTHRLRVPVVLGNGKPDLASVELWSRCVPEGFIFKVGDTLSLDVQHYRPEKIHFARKVKMQKYRALGRESGVVCAVKDQGFGFVRSHLRDTDMYFRTNEILGTNGENVAEATVVPGTGSYLCYPSHIFYISPLSFLCYPSHISYFPLLSSSIAPIIYITQLVYTVPSDIYYPSFIYVNAPIIYITPRSVR